MPNEFAEQEGAAPSDITQSVVKEGSPATNPPHWLTKGVWGIGLASFLADVGHEVPTALFASLVTIQHRAPAAVFGLIEGLADGLAGLARFAGGTLFDDPHRRRSVALGYVEKLFWPHLRRKPY
jgi:hypothetical protein